MHATQLAEIANWAAFNAIRLISGTSALTAASCNEYWSQSKCRQNRWMAALKMFEQDLRIQRGKHDPWPAMEIVIQEILLSELLTRVWSAALVAHDAGHRTNELGGIAYSVHIGHVEAKNRAIRLLLNDPTVNAKTFDRLNCLRRKAERWTDLLLAQSPDFNTTIRFAFQPNRVKDFREENRNSSYEAERTRRLLYAASMSEDFNRVAVKFAANPEINRRIAGGVLACFPNDRFNSFGIPKSIQLIWMEKTSDETQLLVNDLAALDHSSCADSCDDASER